MTTISLSHLKLQNDEFVELTYNSSIKEKKWCEIFLDCAKVISKGSHCVSKKVAALIVKNNRIVSTGINGTAVGLKNCDEIFDEKNFNRTEHHNWSKIHEVHAEANAITTAASEGISIKNGVIYTTLSPCTDCCKLIAAANLTAVCFEELYDLDQEGLKALIRANIEVIRVKRS